MDPATVPMSRTGAPVSTSAASAAAPASQRSRSPASASSSGRSKSWRTTPNGNPCSSSVARAPSTRRPSSDARARASSSRRDFPIPAAPSMTRAPPARRPAARSAARTRSSSSLALEQRGRPGKGGLVHVRRSIVSARPDRIARSPTAQCSGVDVRGSARCANRRPGGRMASQQPVPTRRTAWSLIQVKLIEGVFTAQQKQEIVERLTDAMVAIEGENMRQVDVVRRRGGRQRRLGHRRPDPHRRRRQGARAQRGRRRLTGRVGAGERPSVRLSNPYQARTPMPAVESNVIYADTDVRAVAPTRPARLDSEPPSTGLAGTGVRAGVDRGVRRRFRDGDPEAVRAVYRCYGGLVYAIAFSVLGRRALAEEATQQAFLKAWRAAPSLDQSRDMGPWLATIARRAAIDVHRSEALSQRRPPRVRRARRPCAGVPARISRGDVRRVGGSPGRHRPAC